MTYRKFKIALSKGWTLLVCSISVVVLTLTVSCRSKKVTKTPEVKIDENKMKEIVEDFNSKRDENRMKPIVALSNDSQAVKEMIEQTNSLKETLSRRMNSVIYGAPEVLERRARENNEMRRQIDSIDLKIRLERFSREN